MGNSNIHLFFLTNSKNKLDINCAKFPLSKLWSIWNTNIVASTWDEISMIHKLNINCKKIFYMYDLDWHVQLFNFAEQLEILSTVDRILCRSEDHQKEIKNHFGILAEIMPTYDYKELMK